MAVVNTPAGRLPWLGKLTPRFSAMTLITGAAVLLLFYLLIVPLAVQIFAAFRGPTTALPFQSTAYTTLDNLREVYAGGGMTATLIDTSYFVGGSVMLSLMIGFTLAWLIERTDLPYRRLMFVAILMPAIMPGLVRAQAWLLMLAPSTGLFNQGIRAVLPFWETGPINPFSFPGMILVQGIGGATFFFLLLSAVLRNMDGALEEASATSGGGTLQTLRRVTFPIMLPGILAVVMLNMIITVGQFEVPLLFGIGAGANIFSLRIWLPLCCGAYGLPEYGIAAAYALNFLVITYGLFFVYSRLTRQANKYATVTGKGYRPRRLRLGQWRYAAFAFLFGYLMVAFVIPLIVLVWASFFPFFVQITWDHLFNRATLDAYRVVLDDSQFWGGLWRTFVVASLSATIAVTLSMIIAWTVVRGKRGLVNRILDLFASSSVAIPATVAAFAFFMFYIVVGEVDTDLRNDLDPGAGLLLPNVRGIPQQLRRCAPDQSRVGRGLGDQRSKPVRNLPTGPPPAPAAACRRCVAAALPAGLTRVHDRGLPGGRGLQHPSGCAVQPPEHYRGRRRITTAGRSEWG